MSGRRLSARTLLIATVVLTIAGGIIGALASRDIDPSYAATTSVLVGELDRPDLGADFQSSAMVAAVYGRLIRSETVLGPVIGRLDLATDWQELRDRVHVDLGANDIPIISITVYAGSAAEATATASAITDRMVELSRPDVGGKPVTDLGAGSPDSTLTKRAIAKAEQALTRFRAKLAASPPASAQERLQRRIDRESGLLMAWQDIYGAQQSATSSSANDLRILQPAEAKGGRIRPRISVNAGLGASIGCLVGFVLMIGTTVLRSPVRRRPAPSVRGRVVTVPDAGDDTTGDDPWVRELAGSYPET